MNWKLIPKDKWGLFEAEDEEFYNDLPCVVYNEDYEEYEIIDRNNYSDWTHDLSKQRYKWYLPFPEMKGGEEMNCDLAHCDAQYYIFNKHGESE